MKATLGATLLSGIGAFLGPLAIATQAGAAPDSSPQTPPAADAGSSVNAGGATENSKSSDDGKAGKASPVNNDLTNYQGDRIRFQSDLVVGLQSPDGSLLGYTCLPRGSLLIGGTGYSAGSDVGTSFRVTKPAMTKGPGGSVPSKCTRPPDSGPDGKKLIALERFDTIRVTTNQINANPPDRNGLTYGVLAVPFKFHLSGNKEFTGSATLGPYVGYRTTQAGYGLSYVGFVGGSSISVPKTENGKTTTQNLAGLSYGVGIIAILKGNFQLGAVVGFDRVSNDAGYQYNGKSWLAVELGYSFLQ